MAFLQELRLRVLAYVEGKEVLSSLREWFAPLALEVGSCDEPEAKRIVYKMQRSLADESQRYIGEPELKQILFACLFPVPSLSIYKQISFDETAAQTIVTGSFSSSVAVPAAASLGVGPVMEYV